jgi:hypothetical protein
MTFIEPTALWMICGVLVVALVEYVKSNDENWPD